MTPTKAPDYLNPDLPAGLHRYKVPIIKATDESVKGYGNLVDNPDEFKIEVTRWPAQGWRPVDPDSGDEGGVTEGIFTSEWKGHTLFGRNEAVGGEYILGYCTEPTEAKETIEVVPDKILLWHANYHPDGGQLFFPLEKKPFLVPVALPGDDIHPSDFICFYCDGSKGLYIHANIWHEGVFAIFGKHRFIDRQGAVHARISVDFAREFNGLLEISLNTLNSLP